MHGACPVGSGAPPDSLKRHRAPVRVVLLLVNLRAKVFLPEVNPPKGVTSPYHLHEVGFGAAYKGQWEERVELRKRDAERLASVREDRDLVVQDIVLFS